MTDANQLITEHLDIWTAATVKKSSAGRGAGGSVSLYGVKKLRSLILELAVRGKLVQQDEQEGAAEKLLRDLGRGKAELVAKGEIKKPRQIEHRKTQERHSLPSSWLWVHLDQVGAVVGGGTPKASDPKSFKEPGDGFPWLTPADLSGHTEIYIERGSRDLSEIGLAKSSATRMPANTVLFTSRAPIGYVAISACPMATNQGFKSVVPFHIEMSRYIALVLRCFAPEIDAAAPGTTFKEVSGKIVAGLSFPLPPLAEQKRIVAKVDELMALCDALERQAEDSLKAHQTLVETCLATLTNSQSPEDLTQNWTRIETHFDTLFTTEESIKALEEVIIQLGVSGLMGTGNPADEAADSILKEIGRRNPKSKNGKRSGLRGQVSLNQSNGLNGELPKGWELVEFSELIEPSKPISYGVLVPGKDTDGGVPFVRIADLSIYSPAELPDKSISQKVDDQYARTRLEGGEILMGVVGSIGKLGVAPKSWRGANIARAVCRIVPAQELSKNFVLLLLRSRMMQERFRGDTRVLAQPTLNIGLIRSAPTPLPPLAEQHRIVERVEELLKVSARLRSLIETSQSTSLILADTLTSKIH